MRRLTARASVLALAVLAGGAVVAPGGPTASAAPRPAAQDSATCAWPQWGYDAAKTFSTPCETAISPATAKDLQQVWFFNAKDTVTASPAIVGRSLYVGDWSGNFYALNTRNGKRRWTFEAPLHRQVYAGQIVSSAAVADVDGVPTVYVGSGKTLYALRARTGKLRWKFEVGRPGDGDDPTEIESSPVVVDDIVYFGSDVHNSGNGEPAGVYTLDAATGEEKWMTVTAPTEGDRPTGSGCGDVWGSPSADVDAGLLFVGTGNCNTSPEGFGRFTEAILALDLETGDVRWTFSAHEPNNDDSDFAGAPNLFTADGRELVGLGNKDAAYYTVDRATGELVWKTQATEPGIEGPNYSRGGFIGGSAVADGTIVGGTAVGGTPALHAFDAATGAIKWQQSQAGPTFASAAEANGVVFLGGTTDFSFRALDLATGDVLWSQEMRGGGVAGGAAIVGDDVYAVAGIREPGVGNRNRNSGVYRFSLDAKPVTSSPRSTAPRTPSTPANPEAANQECVATPCAIDFGLTSDRLTGPPTPTGTLHVTLDPFRLTVETDGLGEPSRWLRPGSAAAAEGASTFGVFLSQGTDDPTGGLICELDADGDCSGRKLPAKNVSYDRVSILAVTDTSVFPSLSEGFDRLVSTNAFRIPITPKAGPR